MRRATGGITDRDAVLRGLVDDDEEDTRRRAFRHG
jgi:hypothetical protein